MIPKSSLSHLPNTFFSNIDEKKGNMAKNPLNFTETQHTEVTPAIDPAQVKLSPGFTVCVVGASRGIGASIAYSYARAGASCIILAARSSEALETVGAKCKEIQPDCFVHCEPCDISLNESVETLAKNLKQKMQRLDVVVVNSGFSGPVITKITEGDPAQWQTCLDVNTLGSYHVAHHLLPILLESDGARSFLIVSTAAVTLTEGIIANTAYCVSKLAQLRMLEMVAKQYSGQRLLAVGIHPGAVATEMAETTPKAFRDRKVTNPNLGRTARLT